MTQPEETPGTPQFTPFNQLERDLLACHQGEMEVPEFIERLIASNVVVLMPKEQPQGLHHLVANPLALDSPAGYPALVAFTSPLRGAPMALKHPQFSHGLLCETRWLLRAIDPVVGLALNPYCNVGLEIPPDALAELMHEYRLDQAA